MRILAVALILVAFAVIPQPAGANHDPTDTYTTIGFGDGTTFYLDDGVPIPMIYRETNGFSGLQRDFDSSGHLGHGNHDQRIF